MRKALCRDVNFVQAKLGGTDLRGCDMQGSNFTDANLRVANLEGATFHFANLLRVNLEGANTKGVRGSIEGYRSSR